MTITGKKTGRSLSWGYGQLHQIRDFTLVVCGAPEYLDNKETVLTKAFNCFPWVPARKELDDEKMSKYLFVLRKSGYYFPNILLHADHTGKYTRTGKICSNYALTTGNSVQLLKELKLLLDQAECKISRFASIVQCMQALHDLVEDELTNGCGTIIFS